MGENGRIKNPRGLKIAQGGLKILQSHIAERKLKVGIRPQTTVGLVKAKMVETYVRRRLVYYGRDSKLPVQALCFGQKRRDVGCRKLSTIKLCCKTESLEKRFVPPPIIIKQCMGKLDAGVW